jgi:hypothetical protein
VLGKLEVSRQFTLGRVRARAGVASESVAAGAAPAFRTFRHFMVRFLVLSLGRRRSAAGGHVQPRPAAPSGPW